MKTGAVPVKPGRLLPIRKKKAMSKRITFSYWGKSVKWWIIAYYKSRQCKIGWLLLFEVGFPVHRITRKSNSYLAANSERLLVFLVKTTLYYYWYWRM